jgi:hypothetical protein
MQPRPYQKLWWTKLMRAAAAHKVRRITFDELETYWLNKLYTKSLLYFHIYYTILYYTYLLFQLYYYYITLHYYYYYTTILLYYTYLLTLLY